MPDAMKQRLTTKVEVVRNLARDDWALFCALCAWIDLTLINAHKVHWQDNAHW